MKINIQNFIAEITDENFPKQNENTTKGKLTKSFNSTIKPVVKFIIDHLKQNQIAQAALVTKRPEANVRLETNVINLPMRYVKNISKVTRDKGEYDLNVYMIIESPDVNRSKLRIDQLASADKFIKDPDQYLPKFKTWLTKQFQQIDDNKKDAKKKASKTKKKSKTSKKSKNK